MRHAQLVLIGPWLKVAAGINEEDSIIGFVAPEEEDRRRDACTEKEILGEANHGIQQIFPDELLSDLTFRVGAEEYAMRDNHASSAFGRFHGLYHVLDKGVVTLAFGRNSTAEALEAVG